MRIPEIVLELQETSLKAKKNTDDEDKLKFLTTSIFRQVIATLITNDEDWLGQKGSEIYT